MDDPTAQFDVVCPRCQGHAVGATVRLGIRGDYREALVHFGLRAISCTHCGYAKSVERDAARDFRFWYRVSVDRHEVWVPNRDQLLRLVAFLEAGGDRNAGFYALPRWMITQPRRARIAKKLRALLA